jgi:hypothetical protein
MMVSEQTPGDQRVKFTAAEDNLMALGMVHYDKKWSVIQSKILPSKTLKQVTVPSNCNVRLCMSSHCVSSFKFDIRISAQLVLLTILSSTGRKQENWL